MRHRVEGPAHERLQTCCTYSSGSMTKKRLRPCHTKKYELKEERHGFGSLYSQPVIVIRPPSRRKWCGFFCASWTCCAGGLYLIDDVARSGSGGPLLLVYSGRRTAGSSWSLRLAPNLLVHNLRTSSTASVVTCSPTDYVEQSMARSINT
jgi:hypothetical protein